MKIHDKGEMSQKFVRGKSCQNPVDLNVTENLLDVEQLSFSLPGPGTYRNWRLVSIRCAAQNLGLHVVGFLSGPFLLLNRRCKPQ